MARYGRDFGRDRWQGGEDHDRGGWSGGGMNRGGMGMGRGGMGGEYGGMRSDRQTGGGSERSGFGPGGGAYDNEFSAGGFGGGMERDLDRGFGGGGMGNRGMGNRGFGDRDFGGGGDDELRRMRASEVMTEDPETVTADTNLADAARKMRDLDVGIIPVVESENSRRLKGVITDRDIAVRAVAEGKDANSTRVGDVMTSGVETCNKNDTLRDVMSVMEREQVRRVPITDREGRLVGIIAQADIATDLDSPRSRKRVARTVESISEPAHPRGRGMGGGRSGQSRGRDTGGWDASGRGKQE
jgi:CBS domain-containing protein